MDTTGATNQRRRWGSLLSQDDARVYKLELIRRIFGDPGDPDKTDNAARSFGTDTILLTGPWDALRVRRLLPRDREPEPSTRLERRLAYAFGPQLASRDWPNDLAPLAETFPFLTLIELRLQDVPICLGGLGVLDATTRCLADKLDALSLRPYGAFDYGFFYDFGHTDILILLGTCTTAPIAETIGAVRRLTVGEVFGAMPEKSPSAQRLLKSHPHNHIAFSTISHVGFSCSQGLDPLGGLANVLRGLAPGEAPPPKLVPTILATTNPGHEAFESELGALFSSSPGGAGPAPEVTSGLFDIRARFPGDLASATDADVFAWLAQTLGKIRRQARGRQHIRKTHTVWRVLQEALPYEQPHEHMDLHLDAAHDLAIPRAQVDAFFPDNRGLADLVHGFYRLVAALSESQLYNRYIADVRGFLRKLHKALDAAFRVDEEARPSLLFSELEKLLRRVSIILMSRIAFAMTDVSPQIFIHEGTMVQKLNLAYSAIAHRVFRVLHTDPGAKPFEYLVAVTYVSSGRVTRLPWEQTPEFFLVELPTSLNFGVNLLQLLHEISHHIRSPHLDQRALHEAIGDDLATFVAEELSVDRAGATPRGLGRGEIEARFRAIFAEHVLPDGKFSRRERMREVVRPDHLIGLLGAPGAPPPALGPAGIGWLFDAAERIGKHLTLLQRICEEAYADAIASSICDVAIEDPLSHPYRSYLQEQLARREEAPERDGPPQKDVDDYRKPLLSAVIDANPESAPFPWIARLILNFSIAIRKDIEASAQGDLAEVMNILKCLHRCGGFLDDELTSPAPWYHVARLWSLAMQDELDIGASSTTIDDIEIGKGS
jgi:hypothetical protein